MLSPLSQVVALSRLHFLSFKGRLWTSFSVAASVALVVFVLLAALAMNKGFTTVLQSGGADSVGLLLRAGSTNEITSVLTADQVDTLSTAPGILFQGGAPLLSPEVLTVIDAVKRSTGARANVALRGIGHNGEGLRKSVRFVQGRMFSLGTNELVVGRGLAAEFSGFDVGQEVRLRGAPWRVVGIFASGQGVAESEIWCDVSTLQGLLARGSSVQALRVGLAGEDGLQQLRNFIAQHTRLNVDLRTERQYFSEQAAYSTNLVNFVGKPIAAFMALGALAGALNAMYSSLADRRREIATLRILGFEHLPLFIAVMFEALLPAAAGALIGSLAAWLAVDQLSSSLTGTNFSTVVFQMSIRAPELLEALLWSSAIGFLGGIFPAIDCITTPIVVSVASQDG